MKPVVIFILICFLTMLALPAACSSNGTGPLKPQDRVKVATTTSLYDTGLWGYLEPKFEKMYDVE